MNDETVTSYCDLQTAVKALSRSQKELEGMIDEVARARVIKESHGERKKQALAKAMAKSGVDSMAKAEVAARIDDEYLRKVEEIDGDLEVAEKSLLRWSVAQTRIEGLRTVISLQKSVIAL